MGCCRDILFASIQENSKMTTEEEVQSDESLSEILTSRKNLVVLQKIGTEIETKRNAPQELWASLRDWGVAVATSTPLGLLHDVMEFCLAVFDSLEPNAELEERQRRIIHVNAMAVSLNVRIGATIQKLSGKDNVFLGKWGSVAVTSMIAMRQPDLDVGLILSAFGTFDPELQQVDQPELVLAVWLYSLYTYIFALAHDAVPAGILGIASLCVGLSVREAKGMV